MIQYRVGDATFVTARGTHFIAHVCNDAGAWGAGFTKALSRRWGEPEGAYRAMRSRELGTVQFVTVDVHINANTIYVANMIAQHGFGLKVADEIPLRYDALESCLWTLGSRARDQDASVHMPRIGCGLAGGRWEVVEPIVLRQLHSLQVFVYDLPSGEKK